MILFEKKNKYIVTFFFSMQEQKIIVLKDESGKVVLPKYFSKTPNKKIWRELSEENKEYGKKIIAGRHELTKEDEKLIALLPFKTKILLASCCESIAKYMYKTFDLRAPPLLSCRDLYNFQWNVVEKMIHFEKNTNHGISGGILSLQMGLGKTFVCMFHALCSPRGRWPTLIVCKKSLSIPHSGEIRKFFGTSVKYLVMTKDALGTSINNLTADYIQHFDIVLTTYETCQSASKMGDRNGGYFEQIREYGEFGLHKDKVIGRTQRTPSQLHAKPGKGLRILYDIEWERICCDESQKFANPNSRMFEHMLALCGKHKWCLTGTLTRNYSTDSWSQLYFCGYNGEKSPKQWKARYDELLFEHNIIARNFIELTYESAEVEMPPLEEKLVELSFSKKELSIYISILAKANRIVNDVFAGRLNYAELLAVFTALRKSCLCSYLSIRKAGDDTEDSLNYEDEKGKEKVTKKSKKRISESDDESDEESDSDEENKGSSKSDEEGGDEEGGDEEGGDEEGGDEEGGDEEGGDEEGGDEEGGDEEGGDEEGDEESDEDTDDMTKKVDELVGGTESDLRDWIRDINSTSGKDCTKINKLLEILRSIPKGEKTLIFSNFCCYLEVIQKRLKEENINFSFLHGKVKPKDRESILKKFKEDPEQNVLFLSYGVGAEGLNITEATHVIFMEPWWNRAVMDQAKQRAWRLGQKRKVTTYTLVFGGSIETQILEICGDKQKMAEGIKKGNRRENKKQEAKSRLSKEKLREVIQSQYKFFKGGKMC